MRDESRERLLGELKGLIPDGRIEEIRKIERSVRRVGCEIDLLRDVLRSSTMGMWCGAVYWFSGRIYERLEGGVRGGEFGDLIYEMIRYISGDWCDDVLRIESAIRVLWRVVSSRELCMTRNVVVFKNCVLNLDTGEVSGFSSRFVQFYALDYDYDPNAKGHMWDEFLREVLPVESHRMILQEFIGALFVDRSKIKIEKMLILKGAGSNGKSVVFNAVTGILGRRNVSNYDLGKLVIGNEARQNIADMNGRRLNYASETRRCNLGNESGTLKALISGEPVEARMIYCSPFTAYDIPLMMMNANQMPDFGDWSYGMRRRIMVLPFDVEIPEWRQRKDLSDLLRREYPYILNWALEGRARLLRNQGRFTENRAIEQLLDELHAESSSVLMFMQTKGYERMALTERDTAPIWTSLSDLYSDYCYWCVRSDEYSEGKRTFARVLDESGFKKKRGANGIRYALYGESALQAEVRRIKRKEQYGEEKKEAPMDPSLALKWRNDMVKRIQYETGWRKVCFGTRELTDAIGFKFNVLSQIKNGNLDGMYILRYTHYFFNLDVVMTEFVPKYRNLIRGGASAKGEKAAVALELKEMISKQEREYDEKED